MAAERQRMSQMSQASQMSRMSSIRKTKLDLEPERFVLPLDEEEVDRDAGQEQGKVDPDQLGGDQDGKDHQEEADDQEPDRQQQINLLR